MRERFKAEGPPAGAALPGGFATDLGPAPEGIPQHSHPLTRPANERPRVLSTLTTTYYFSRGAIIPPEKEPLVQYPCVESKG